MSVLRRPVFGPGRVIITNSFRAVSSRCSSGLSRQSWKNCSSDSPTVATLSVNESATTCSSVKGSRAISPSCPRLYCISFASSVTVGAVYEGVNKLAVSTMSAVRWLLSAVYCTCFADQTTKSGQWVISSSKQVHYTSDNSQLTADKFRRLPDFFHSSIDRHYSQMSHKALRWFSRRRN